MRTHRNTTAKKSTKGKAVPSPQPTPTSTTATLPPTPEEAAAHEKIGLPLADHHHLDSHAYRRSLSLAGLFSAFLGSYDDDPIEAGMVALADDLDNLTTTAGTAAPDAPICLSDGVVAEAIHRAAARLRVLAELHRRAAEAV
jgi:hypothetical protein